MKNTFLLTFALILLAGSPLKAQEKEEAATLNKVVNTLKERITLAGYAQLGYTYDDAAKKILLPCIFTKLKVFSFNILLTKPTGITTMMLASFICDI